MPTESPNPNDVWDMLHSVRQLRLRCRTLLQGGGSGAPGMWDTMAHFAITKARAECHFDQPSDERTSTSPTATLPLNALSHDLQSTTPGGFTTHHGPLGK